MSTPAPLRCPVCGTHADPNHLSCEACGADLHQPIAPQGHWLSSAADPRPCAECGRNAFDALGYCDQCGHRRTITSDRTELDLTCVAAATDFGKRHKYNQDAVAIGRFESTAVTVVCDGVSSSTFGELAALAGVEAGVAAMLDGLADKQTGHEASLAGVRAAAAASARTGAGLEDNPPSCTYVSAVVDDTTITVTWVGDSRAYWIGPDRAVCLTVDDSQAGRLAALGVPESDERYRAPYATALLAWLGSDAPELQPNIATHTPTSPGTLVVCSDGLSGYTGSAEELAALIPTGGPAHIAGTMTEWARNQGGRDNISVAVTHFPPSASLLGVDPSITRLEPGEHT